MAPASACSSRSRRSAWGSERRSLLAFRQQVEGHEGGRRLRRELLDPRRRRVQAHLQRVEVEPARAHDHDLAVHHAALGQARPKEGLELGEVAVERLQVAALDVEPVAVAEHERAEAVPLRLEEPAVTRGQLGGELGEHRLDRRLDGEARVAFVSAISGLPAARGDPPLRRRPARVEGVARLVDVDQERRVVGRDRLALARLAVDLRPDACARRAGA